MPACGHEDADKHRAHLKIFPHTQLLITLKHANTAASQEHTRPTYWQATHNVQCSKSRPCPLLSSECCSFECCTVLYSSGSGSPRFDSSHMKHTHMKTHQHEWQQYMGGMGTNTWRIAVLNRKGGTHGSTHQMNTSDAALCTVHIKCSPVH